MSAQCDGCVDGCVVRRLGWVMEDDDAGLGWVDGGRVMRDMRVIVSRINEDADFDDSLYASCAAECTMCDADGHDAPS